MSAGIATLLDGLGGITSVPYLSDNLNPPTVLVGTGEAVYHGAFGSASLGTYNFDVFLIVPRSSDQAAINMLEAFMSVSGTTSIPATLEASQHLGCGAAGVKVVSCTAPVGVQLSSTGVVYTAVTFKTEVYADGS